MGKMRKGLIVLVPLLVVTFLLVVPSVALADDGEGQVRVFGNVTVGPNKTVIGDVGSVFGSVSVQGQVTGDVFSIFSSVSVSGQGHVTGDVFSVFSSVTVSGQSRVDGNGLSVFSSVALRDSSVVAGNVMSVFSSTHKDPSARVGGEIVTPEKWNWPEHTRWRFERRLGHPWGSTEWLGRVFGGVFAALLLAGVSVLTVVLFPTRVEVVKQTLVDNPGASLGVGFLGLIVSLPLALILIITCLGFFAVILATFLATLLGLVAIGLWIGQRVMDTTESRTRSATMDVLVGSLILGLVMAALDVVPFMSCLTGPIWFGLFSLGLGAVLLSRLGTTPPLTAGVAAPPTPQA